MKLFRDPSAFKPDGPIFALAARIHQIKTMRGTTIEFDNPARRREVCFGFISVVHECEAGAGGLLLPAGKTLATAQFVLA